MTDYDDAIVERPLYAKWLTRQWGVRYLSGMVGRLLKSGGYTVHEPFFDGLDKMLPEALAMFLACNSPFEVDDKAWLAHCAATYPRSGHPSLTPQERDGSLR